MLANGSEIRVILARWSRLADGVAAHGAFVTFWAVRTVVWAVFGARRSPLAFFDRLAHFQLLSDPLLPVLDCD